MAPLQIASFCGIFLLIVCHLGDSSNPLASTKGNETRVDAGSSANAAKEKGDNIAQKQQQVAFINFNRTCKEFSSK